jgi:hypothetical protein
MIEVASRYGLPVARRERVQMRTNFYLDIAIFLIFLFGFEPALIGRTTHEWWNLTLACALIAHLVIHWDWTAAVTFRFFRKTSNSARINYVIDLILLAVFVMMVLSGLMISRSVLSFFGLKGAPRSVWRELHSIFGNLALILVGLHIALHWRWITDTWARYCALYIKKRHQRQLVNL